MSTLSLRSFNMSSTEELMASSFEEKRKVVVAMDGSDHALYALNWYKENIHKPNDYVYLVYSIELQHIVHNSKWHYSPQFNNADTLGPLIKEEHVIIKDRIEKLKHHLEELDIDGEVKTVQSHKPGEGVVKEATELCAGLIVTGTRGYGTLRRTILGSVSDYILHHSSVPVIVCHRKHKEKQ